MQPEHEEWWGITPLQPATAFYPRTSKCKKCYIRLRQTNDSKRPGPAVETGQMELLDSDLRRYNIRTTPSPISPAGDTGYPVTVADSKPTSTSSPLLSSLSVGEFESLYGVSRTHHFPVQVLTNARFFRGRRLSPAYARRFLAARAANERAEAILHHSNAYLSPEAVALLFAQCREVITQMSTGLSKELLHAVITPLDNPVHSRHALLAKTLSLQQQRMDLRSLEQRVHCKRYRTFTDFSKDALLVWTTAAEIFSGSPKALAEIRSARQRTSERIDMSLQTLALQYIASVASLCAVCRESPRVGGRALLPCDGGCFRSFHLSCAFPELLVAPLQSEYWLCHDCKNDRLVYHWDPEQRHYFCLDFSDALQRFEAKDQLAAASSDDEAAEHEELILTFDPSSQQTESGTTDTQEELKARRTKMARLR